MFTPRPSPPPLIPKPALVMIVVGLVAAFVAVGIRFDERAGAALPRELHALADGTAPLSG